MIGNLGPEYLPVNALSPALRLTLTPDFRTFTTRFLGHNLFLSVSRETPDLGRAFCYLQLLNSAARYPSQYPHRRRGHYEPIAGRESSLLRFFYRFQLLSLRNQKYSTHVA